MVASSVQQWHRKRATHLSLPTRHCSCRPSHALDSFSQHVHLQFNKSRFGYRVSFCQCHSPSFPFASRSLLDACFDTDWILDQIPCRSVSLAILSPPFLIGSNHRNSPNHQYPFVILQPSFEMQRSSLHSDLALWTQNVHDFVQRKKKVSTEDILNDPRLVSEMESKKKRAHWKKQKKSETMHRTRVVCFWIGGPLDFLFSIQEKQNIALFILFDM